MKDIEGRQVMRPRAALGAMAAASVDLRARPSDQQRRDERDPEDDRIRRSAGVTPTSGQAVDERDRERPPATGGQEVRDRQQQEHRVVVPQDRRDELARDHRDEVRRLVGRPADRARGSADNDRIVLTSCTPTATVVERPELVGDRSRGQVALGRDRVADRPEEHQEVGPCAGARRGASRTSARTTSTTTPTTTARNRRVRSAQTSTSPGCSLMAAPSAALRPSATGSSMPRQPTANAQEQDRPDLPELDGVDERERQAGEQHDPPAHRARDRQDRDAHEERHQRQADPDPGRRSARTADRTAAATARRSAGSRTARSHRSP